MEGNRAIPVMRQYRNVAFRSALHDLREVRDLLGGMESLIRPSASKGRVYDDLLPLEKDNGGEIEK